MWLFRVFSFCFVRDISNHPHLFIKLNSKQSLISGDAYYLTSEPYPKSLQQLIIIARSSCAYFTYAHSLCAFTTRAKNAPTDIKHIY